MLTAIEQAQTWEKLMLQGNFEDAEKIEASLQNKITNGNIYQDEIDAVQSIIGQKSNIMQAHNTKVASDKVLQILAKKHTQEYADAEQRQKPIDEKRQKIRQIQELANIGGIAPSVNFSFDAVDGMDIQGIVDYLHPLDDSDKNFIRQGIREAIDGASSRNFTGNRSYSVKIGNRNISDLQAFGRQLVADYGANRASELLKRLDTESMLESERLKVLDMTLDTTISSQG
ncbi:MAG: hypothetical protein AAB116_17355 [Candidatus Poribacteria bacterium]